MTFLAASFLPTMTVFRQASGFSGELSFVRFPIQLRRVLRFDEVLAGF